MSEKNNKHTLLKMSALALGAMAYYNYSENKKALETDIHRRQGYRVFNGKFTDIYYTRTGKGSPMLLVHDISAVASSYEWNKVVDKLAENHSVYVIDLPGCGNSSKKNTEYTIFMYAKAINEFVESRILRSKSTKVIAVSSGMSAAIIATAAMLSGNLYSQLRLINPATECMMLNCNPNARKLIRYTINAPIIGTFLYNVKFSKPMIKNMLNLSGCSSLESEEFEKYENAMFEASHLNCSRTKYLYSSIEGGLMYVDLPKMIERIKDTINIVIISGEEYVTPDLPKVEKLVISGCQIPHLENPDTLVEAFEHMEA